jgi:hypothetical protein
MPPTGRPDKRDLFEIIALQGPAIFLQAVIPPEKLGPDYSHFNPTNSRLFLLLRILVEVQKTGFAFRRWRNIDTSPDLQLPVEQLTSIHRLILDSCIDEQSVWQRKLSEALVLLINFSQTNTAPHYYHYILLQERIRQHSRCREYEAYFSRQSEGCQRKLQEIEQRVSEVASSIGNQPACWYVDQNRGNGLNITSFARQLSLALDHATALERTALSYTYCKGFGETSGNIHFNPLRPLHARPYDRFLLGFSVCGLLAINILKRCHELTNVTPAGINERVLTTAGNLVGRDPTKGAAERGDHVLVEGPCLGVVEEVATAKYGYEVYRVRLAGSQSGQSSEWFSAFDITPFTKQRDQLDTLRQMIAEHAIAFDPPLSLEEMEQALQEAMGTIWQAGLAEHVKTTARRLISEPESQ